ncbi:sigma-70 family RNA polymerase sigma factor [Alkaliphilus pronyensis]|uniref:Sigma-70 family RNA polymerase sigma factor n=1 Tax=Alkaliphilus pronyensis TaxID=1482732 RepID=A0A6I0F8L8_9FIRM|nr:sigma-70 family RNA polymerase sigma factor [Alkaliphilus pronyensis]KAB3534418.1 sigma-70 family RNA polymerase sigma factor [Alkaliphilus pronyensis]
MTNEELVVDYQNGNQEALDQLITQNKGLVHYFVKRYCGFCKQSFVDEDDLVQEGYIGLMNAAKKFDPVVEGDEPKIKFSSYAYKAIMGRIFRSVNDYIPREKKSDLESELINVNSIQDFIPGSEDITFEDMLVYENDIFKTIKDFERAFDNEILKQDLLDLFENVFGKEFTVDLCDPGTVLNKEALLDKLKDGITPKEVILLHYGLLGKKMSFASISEYVDLSVERISMIELKALQTIRTSDFISEFIDRYGFEFGINKEKWFQSLQEATSFDVVEDRISSIDDLLEELIS